MLRIGTSHSLYVIDQDGIGSGPSSNFIYDRRSFEADGLVFHLTCHRHSSNSVMVSDSQNNASVGFSVQVPTPTLITGFVQSFLQGIIFVQASQYWETAWDNDSRWLQSYVVVVVLLST
jgi:hypothetical protein